MQPRVVATNLPPNTEPASSNPHSIHIYGRLYPNSQFDTRKIPKLPKEVLAQFRRELPAPAADSSRPVPTYGIWDALSGGGGGGAEGSAPSEELESAHAAEWAVVDERTMDGRQFSRMQRQSLRGGGGGEASFRAEAGVMGMQRGKGRGRRKCPLQDERGRVKVDFRAVGSLTPYLSEGGKILGKRRSGLSAKSQRKVARAIKTARTMGLIAREPRVGLTYEELMELEKSL